jgi:hypothetical protein
MEVMPVNTPVNNPNEDHSWFKTYIKNSTNNIVLLSNKTAYFRKLSKSIENDANLKQCQVDNLRQVTRMYHVISEYDLSDVCFSKFVITAYTKIQEFYCNTHCDWFLKPETLDEILVYHSFITVLKKAEQNIIKLLPADYNRHNSQPKNISDFV